MEDWKKGKVMAEVRDAIFRGARRKFQASPFVLLISDKKIKTIDP
jgi:hypothetical protein